MICKNTFFVYNYRKNSAKCCSLSCTAEYFKKYSKGINKVKKIKKKCQECGKVFYVLPCRTKILKHCSTKCTIKFKIKQFSRKNNPMWKGGVTPKNEKIRKSIEYRLWREAVFARDNYTCQVCNKKGIFLEAHHIKKFSDYPKLRLAIDNGKTLCKKCHNKTRKGRSHGKKKLSK